MQPAHGGCGVQFVLRGDAGHAECIEADGDGGGEPGELEVFMRLGEGGPKGESQAEAQRQDTAKQPAQGQTEGLQA
jgi:hypothetical protein